MKGSIESLCRETGIACFPLDIGTQSGTSLAQTRLAPRLQRAIGVIYSPETERASHYFEVSLPRQLDFHVWFAQTTPVTPLLPCEPAASGARETYPFGL